MATTIRRTPIISNIPDAVDYRVDTINQFNGIIQADNPLRLKNYTASDMKNLYVDKNGVLSTRPRTELLFNYALNVKNSIRIDDVLYILTTTNVLYKQTSTPSVLVEILKKDSSVVITELKSGFKKNGVVFILGNDFFLVNPDTNKLEFVFNNPLVYVPYVKQGVDLSQNIDIYEEIESLNILTSKYRISYYWDGVSSLEGIGNGKLIENNNIKTTSLPDAMSFSLAGQHLANGYMLQYTSNQASLIKVNRDLDYTLLQLSIPDTDTPIKAIKMSNDLSLLAIIDSPSGGAFEGTRLRYFDYDLETNICSNERIVTGDTGDYYFNNSLFFNSDGSFLMFGKGSGSGKRYVLTTATNTIREVGLNLAPFEVFQNKQNVVWKDAENVYFYDFNNGGVDLYEYKITTSDITLLNLSKNITASNLTLLALNNNGSKLLVITELSSDGKLVIYNTEDLSILFETNDRPYATSASFDSLDNIYLASDNNIYIYYKTEETYTNYYNLLPPIEEFNDSGYILTIDENHNIWTGRTIYSYISTVEPGIIVEYETLKHLENFITYKATPFVFDIQFPTNYIIDLSSYKKDYKFTQFEIHHNGLQLDWTISNPEEQGIRSITRVREGVYYILTYNITDTTISLLNINGNPLSGVAWLSVRALKRNINFNFTTTKTVFNEQHFGFKNIDYFSDNSYDQLYIYDYNICGNDSVIKDYAILNSEYAIILKEKGAFLLTIDNNGYERYIEFKGDIGTDYSSSITSQYNNILFFGNANGLYTLSTITNISVFDNATVNTTQTILKLFNSISDKTSLITASDDIWTYFIYPGTTSKILVFDGRFSQWFYWEVKNNIITAYVENEELYLVTNNGLVLKMVTTDLLNEYNKCVTEYYDYNKEIIEWFWKSQIMSLGTINRFKQLTSTTFIMTDTDSQDEFGLNYKFKIFRKFMSETGEETTTEKLNYIKTTTKRTYISRFNFIQLELSNVPNNLEQNKLRLVGLTFKFRLVGGII